MIACSTTSTCVKNVVRMTGRVQYMGSTIWNVVSSRQSTSCCLALCSSHSGSNYSGLHFLKTLSCPSIRFHTLQKNCFRSNFSKQRSNLQSLSVEGVVRCRGPLKRRFNISFPCQDMAVRFSISKQEMLSKIKGNVGSVSWSQRYAATGIIFGLLLCYSSSEPTHAEAATQKMEDSDNCNTSKLSHGKEVYTNYSIIGERQLSSSLYNV